VTVAFIGLGSNLDDPSSHITQAFLDLDTIEQTQIDSYSPLYRSSAVGPGQQDDYINAAAKINTDLPAINLLRALQAIERKHKRVKTERWGPRTLDLDILLYGNEIIQNNELTIPHRQIAFRNFVLNPLFDLSPTLILPCGISIGTLLAQCAESSLIRLGNNE
jgi:2-amino-4-hydroxy-6-hydroxymethyldihydropteridine diphosphokinase